MARRVNPFKTEADLCAAFRSEAEQLGWTVYPEAHGDLLLVAGPDVGGLHDDGDRPSRCAANFAGMQVVVEAKQQASVDLLRQIEAKTSPYCAAHPDAVVALVPFASHDYRQIVRRLGACMIEGVDLRAHRASLPGMRGLRVRHSPISNLSLLPWRGPKRLQVPGLVIDVPAGVPSPSGWSKWKEAAVRFALQHADGSTFRSRDIAAAGLSVTTLRSLNIIEIVERGSAYTYRLVDSDKRPDRQYPEIADAVRAMNNRGYASIDQHE